ncbi:MAG TPA: Gfo/Idh/MocA family oxidoreductase [Burkholderiales bacterium]|jgi:predicted dehydrogenase|nr:Gfo/Idh/MocA family oxidoreductase [Burkholderiales bacterium]
MKQKLRAAVIGVGYLGQFHAEKLAALEDVELVGVADADAARARHIAAKHGCAAHGEPRALLGNVDLVCIAVPTERHHEVALEFLEAGVHVLLEKPMTRTLEEADTLLAAARAHGALLAVGHLERFNPAFRALAQGFARPLYIECERLSGFKQRGIDVDVVLDLMIHDLDLARALARSEIGHVSACGFQVMTEAIDIANVRIEFASGCVANLSASRVSQVQVRKLRVFQSGEYASADLQAGKLRVVRRDPRGGAIAQDESSFEDRDALRAEIENFVAAVREGRAPLVTGEDGRAALALALEVSRLVHARLQRYAAVTR